jgi:hypothetical protein
VLDQEITGEILMNVRNHENWYKSSFSINDGGCVEVSVRSDSVGIRDSKDPSGPSFVVSLEEWAGFTESVERQARRTRLVESGSKLGKSEIRIAVDLADVEWVSSQGKCNDLQFGQIHHQGHLHIVVLQKRTLEFLLFTSREWLAFVEGVRLGEFSQAEAIPVSA